MVRGKRREFALGVVLCFVTFGVYPLYWHFAAFKELHDQERRQDFPMGLFLLACLFWPFALMYLSKQLDFVNELRVRNGLTPILGIGEFVLWYTLGSLIVVGPYIAYSRLQNGINELWDIYTAKKPEVAPDAMAA